MATATQGGLAAEMLAIGEAARAACRLLANAPTTTKDEALRRGARALRDDARLVLDANAHDLDGARHAGAGAAVLDRLALDERRVAGIADGLDAIAQLPDPVGRELARWTRPNGLDIARVAVPLGVIGIVYESRPNVTADAGALCLKSGNAVILRGGSESFRSSRAIVGCLHRGLREVGLPETAIQLVPTTDREAVGHLLRMSAHVDVLVPRGGRALIERVQAESRIPVLAHLDGNCHVYLHAAADLEMAVAVTLNAKLRRTGVCGAAESLLCDAASAERLLPPVLGALIEAGCEVRGDEAVRRLEPRAVAADAADWSTEYLGPIISAKVVDDLGAAIAHVNRYGSRHTDAIVTADEGAAARFVAEVDSAIVLVNASTQFADGGEFGMGAEIGIATGRLHARGPVGLEQLTTMKYVVRGTGQTRPG